MLRKSLLVTMLSVATVALGCDDDGPTAPTGSTGVIYQDTNYRGDSRVLPASAAECTGSDENVAFYAEFARIVEWAVYCPVLPGGWFVDRELAGGGAIMDHTVHLVDIMRWFTGSEVETMYARSNKVFHADEVEVETGALEMLTFENDVFATIDASWSRPQYWPTWGGLTFEMVTQRGAVVVDAFRQNLNVYRHDWQRSNWAYWGSDMNHAMVSEFAAAIRENRPPRVTGLDGLRAVEATLAAYESDRTGQTVQVKKT